MKHCFRKMNDNVLPQMNTILYILGFIKHTFLFIGCAILQLPRLVMNLNTRIKETFSGVSSKNNNIIQKETCSTV